MKKGENKIGFTIIEVALVLAIAGLIFLMVFVALPALQRSQRDTRRRDDVITFLSNVKKYQTNNRGALPGGANEMNQNTALDVAPNSSGGDTTWAGFLHSYMGDNFSDPDGSRYGLTVMRCGATTANENCTNNKLNSVYAASFPNNYRMVVVLQASCYGERVVASSNPRKIAVLYRLEGAGMYCNNT